MLMKEGNKYQVNLSEKDRILVEIYFHLIAGRRRVADHRFKIISLK
jgi:hypothetical protein